MQLKCKVGCEKIQLSFLLRKKKQSDFPNDPTDILLTYQPLKIKKYILYVYIKRKSTSESKRKDTRDQI